MSSTKESAPAHQRDGSSPPLHGTLGTNGAEEENMATWFSWRPNGVDPGSNIPDGITVVNRPPTQQPPPAANNQQPANQQPASPNVRYNVIFPNQQQLQSLSRNRRAFMTGMVTFDLTTAAWDEKILEVGLTYATRGNAESLQEFNRRRNMAYTMQSHSDGHDYYIDLEPGYQTGDEMYHSDSDYSDTDSN